jgi:hypothetical protein
MLSRSPIINFVVDYTAKGKNRATLFDYFSLIGPIDRE